MRTFIRYVLSIFIFISFYLKAKKIHSCCFASPIFCVIPCQQTMSHHSIPQLSLSPYLIVAAQHSSTVTVTHLIVAGQYSSTVSDTPHDCGSTIFFYCICHPTWLWQHNILLLYLSPHLIVAAQYFPTLSITPSQFLSTPFLCCLSHPMQIFATLSFYSMSPNVSVFFVVSVTQCCYITARTIFSQCKESTRAIKIHVQVCPGQFQLDQRWS